MLVFNKPLGEKDLLSTQPVFTQLQAAQAGTGRHHCLLHRQWLPCPLFPFQDTGSWQESYHPWHLQGQTFFISLIIGSVSWPAKSLTLLSPCHSPRKSCDPGWAQPMIYLFPAPSPALPPPTICHLPWMPLICLKGDEIGITKNCGCLKPASTPLGCQLSRERRNILSVISGPKL